MSCVRFTECMHPRDMRHAMVRNVSIHRRRLVATASNSNSNSEDSPDLIESFVGKIFGKKVLEDSSPFGMKRMSAEDYPEMYPAVTDHWAAPVQGDSPDIAVIRPLLARTQLEKARIRLAYESQRDGWSAEAFHARLNTFGAALLVLDTEGGSICGGYNPKGWIGIGDDRDAIAAFLFTWEDGDTSKRPIKLPKVGGPGLAVIDKPEIGVKFAPDGLHCLVPGRERTATSRLGSYYMKKPDGGRSLFAPGEDPKRAAVKSVRCYVAEGEGEAWALDGIVWSTQRKEAQE